MVLVGAHVTQISKLHVVKFDHFPCRIVGRGSKYHWKPTPLVMSSQIANLFDTSSKNDSKSSNSRSSSIDQAFALLKRLSFYCFLHWKLTKLKGAKGLRDSQSFAKIVISGKDGYLLIGFSPDSHGSHHPRYDEIMQVRSQNHGAKMDVYDSNSCKLPLDHK